MLLQLPTTDPNVIPVSLNILLGVIMSITGFLGIRAVKAQDEKNKEYDKHLQDCATRAVNHARLEENVGHLVKRCDGIEEAIQREAGRLDKKLDILLERK